MSYAWIIDRDHLEEGSDEGAVGVMGPGDAPDWMIRTLRLPDLYGAPLTDPRVNVRVYTFQMSDDDGDLYYTGRMITDEGSSEDACYGPLGDYGMPNAGCTDIRYPGHPDMDCG